MIWYRKIKIVIYFLSFHINMNDVLDEIIFVQVQPFTMNACAGR
jgi:hypothetical protein